jgi:pyochelin synthetase
VTLQALVSDLARMGVRLRLVDEDRIAVTGPRGGLPQDLLGRITEYKPELIRWLQRAEPEAGLPTIVPDRAARLEPFPLSDLQMSFLVGDSAAMEYPVRPHQYLEFEVEDLDPARFEAAWNRALRQQAANLVVVTPEMQLRAVADPEPMRVEVDDLRGLPDEARERALLAAREAMERRTLPLDRWPWMELRVSLLPGGLARVHLNNNNFFSDGHGTHRLLMTTMASYARPDEPLSPLALTYRDCVVALTALEESPLGRASERYWRQRMASWPAAPAVPLAAGADPRERSRLERREVIVSAPVWTAFKERAGVHGLTPTNALYAVYAEVLSAWSGSRHFLLNNMVTHRQPLHPDIGEVLGNFASLYPLEVDWRPAEPFHARAARLQARVFEDLQHTYWSGVKVLQAFNQLERAPGRAACPFVVGSGLFMGQMDRPTYSILETPQVVLDHQFWEQTDRSLWVIWDLIEALFPDGLVDAMWAAYRGLLERLAGDGAAWELEGFDLLPADQRAVRERLNRPAGPRPDCLPRSDRLPPPDGLLHDALEHAPGDRPAVVTPAGTLTYDALRGRARAVAGALRAAGVRPGDRVIVRLPKSTDQVAAVHGALLAGAAYVPVDPEWPADRLEYLLQDTGAAAVVTTAALRPPGVPTVAVDELPASAPSPDAPRRAPGDLAYVIYTSGSTGRPKGAMLDHRGPLNTVLDINQRIEAGPDDVVFGLSSLCFDLSVYDVFGAAAAGAALLLPDDASAADPGAWLDAVRQHGVTVWNSVPQLVQLLVEAAESAGVTLPSLRAVLMSGDWIPVGLLEPLRRVAPNARAISMGGATEASIWSIWYEVDRVDPAWPSVPYGFPLRNQTWHVLDGAGRDAPVWVPGHLHIGGTGLALGYWNDADRTAAAFAPRRPGGERLYRTGDLGRYLPDGSIEFLGRSDFQVKVQGFRVEPGEVEHACREHPDVREAVVIARDSAGGKQLVAFLVPRPGADLDAEAVRAHLAATLPRHLVPSQLTVLERLPLTGNGKVDRRALEAAGRSAADGRREVVAPRTPVEAALVGIWESVLGGGPIGVHDDFFELGGQSFSALRALTMVDRRFGRRLPMGALLEGRTIAHLAALLARDEGWSPLVPMGDGDGDGEPCYLVHPAGGNVLCYQLLAGALGRPVHAFQAAFDGGAADLEAIAARYVRALRAARPDGPYLLGGWSSGGVIAFEMARQLEAAGQAVRQVLVLDTPAPGHEAPDVDEAGLLCWFLEDLDVGFHAERDGPRLRPALNGGGLAEALALAAADHPGAGGLDAGELAPVLAVFRSVVTACRGYRPRPIAAGIAVVRAADGAVSEFAGHPDAGRPDWGWAALTTGRVATATVPGSHHTLLAEPHVGAVAAAVRSLLA